MDLCPICQKIVQKKIFPCKFCDNFFCSINCISQHMKEHTNNFSDVILSLKKEQSKNSKEKFSFISQGVFADDAVYDEKYNINNFSNICDGLIPVELGIGSYGRVCLVAHKNTKQKYALKIINKHKIFQVYGNWDLIYNEIKIHKKLKHENIIRLYYTSEDEETIKILLEYAKKGDLYNLIQEEKGFSEEKAYKYFIQVVNAVNFLHSNNIIHRDIKPENILITENDTAKLCDFGWAKEITLNNRSTFCGTMEYMAPEIVGSENYDYSVDIWSLGILLYELIMGNSPFRSTKDKNTMVQIKKHLSMTMKQMILSLHNWHEICVKRNHPSSPTMYRLTN